MKRRGENYFSLNTKPLPEIPQTNASTRRGTQAYTNRNFIRGSAAIFRASPQHELISSGS